MAFSFLGGVKNFTTNVTSLKKELSGVYDVLKQIKGIGPSAFGDVNAVLSKSGQFGNGQGNTIFGKTQVNGAPKFSSQTKMGAAQPASNAQQSNYEKTAGAIQSQHLDMGIRQAKFGVAAGVVAATTAFVSGVSGMLPATGQVAQRAGMFYGASAMFGGTSRSRNQSATFNAMRGGITSDMGDAEAFSTLTSFSFMPGSKNMAQGLGDVSAAAKSLGMDNANAAAAVGAMSTGSMGAQLYQYGIRQYDDKGNLRKSGDISKDILQRIFYPGQDVSKIGAEQFARDSMGMNLDYQLSTMGITGDLLTKTKAEMGLAVTGQNPNLSSVDTSGSPLKPFLDSQTSETKLVQKTEKDILIGAQKAADALVVLNTALESTPSLIVQLNSALTTFLATKSGGGVSSLVTGVFGGITSTIMASKTLKYLKNMKTALPGATTLVDDVANTGKTVIDPVTGAAKHVSAAETAASAASKTSLASKVLGKVVAPVFIAVEAKNLLSDPLGNNAYAKAQAKKDAWEKANPNASLGDKALFKVKEAFKDTFGFGGGPTTGFSSNVGSASSGVNAFTLSSGSKPMASGPLAASMGATSISKVMGAGFGAKDPSMTTMTGALNYHTGQDTPMAIGTPVYARFAGTVVERNLSKDLGIAVEVDHGDGHSSIYGHLNSRSVQVGQEVKVGTLLGKSGATGRVRGAHLHFELRKGKVPIDLKFYAAGGDGKNNTASSAAGATPNASSPLTASGSSKVILGTGSEKEWATGLLKKMGAPVLDSSVAALTTWMRHEGGHWKNSAHYNPLNTTLDMSDNESMNGVGVKRYKTWEEGYAATIGTLTGKSAKERGYTGIVDALKDGASTETILAAVNNSAWMTGKTGKNPYKFQGGPTSGFNTNVVTADPSTNLKLNNSTVATSTPGSTNNIYVTLQIQQANQHEAEAFAKTLKKYLEKDNKLQKIGSN